MRLLLIAVALALALPAAADDKAAQTVCFKDAGTGQITAHDGFASVRLSDGREVRLADIVPRMGLSAAAGTSETGLEALVGIAVSVRQSTAAPGQDRYGRLVGDLVRKDTGESVIDHLLAQGLALVDPAVMSSGCLDALFALERKAEADGRGLWGRAAPVRSASEADLVDAAGGYTLVEGVVKSIGETRGAIYLNFGETYRTDFTVLIRRRDGKDWVNDLLGLEGQKVRVRGVLEAWNGGLIRLEHPSQIERR